MKRNIESRGTISLQDRRDWHKERKVSLLPTSGAWFINASPYDKSMLTLFRDVTLISRSLSRGVMATRRRQQTAPIRRALEGGKKSGSGCRRGDGN